MINENEIRPGILLKWKDNNQEFEVGKSLLVKEEFWNHIRGGDIVGIPLTDKWPVCLGLTFTPEDSDDPEDPLHDPEEDIEYKAWDFPDFEGSSFFLSTCNTGKWNFNFEGFDMWVEYVHQVQTLHFAMTKNELPK